MSGLYYIAPEHVANVKRLVHKIKEFINRIYIIILKLH